MRDFIQQCVAGVWRNGAGAKRYTITDPASGQVVSSYAGADSKDVSEAIASAGRGFTQWAATPAWTRGVIVGRIGDQLRARRERLARRITAEQGKPLAESRAEVDRAADFFTWASGEAPRLAARSQRARDGSEVTAGTEPVGPVCAFTPWNYPLVLIAKKVSAALAAGCSCVLKPSEETPGVAVELVMACQDAGLPTDVVNLLIGDPAAISAQLVADPAIRKVSFTGSVSVGRMLATRAAEHLKPITLELGGHAPVIVCGDIEVERLAVAAAEKKFHNAGQACISPTRFLVQRQVFERFAEAFVERSRTLRVGPGDVDGVEMGPLANARRLDAVAALLADARRRQTAIATGGARVERPGFFHEPTVVIDPARDSRLMLEEPFGPIALLTPFDALDEAIALANSLPYGLAAYGFANDAVLQSRLAAELQAGLVGVNTWPPHLPEHPLGGWKDSGLGVEGGREAVESYLLPKLVWRRAAA